jgi:integration host factor subunit beta
MSKLTPAHNRAILEASGVEHRQAAAVTNQVIGSLAAAIIAGETVELRGLGTFEVRERKAYKAHNPRTLAPVEVPYRRVVFFKPGRKIKAAINRPGGAYEN